MTWSREQFGREVLGPITAEFCLRLWALGSMLERPESATMLFCARGGLRLMVAYERFLSVTNLEAPTKISSLMVSRVVALKPAVLRIAEDGVLPQAVSAALSYEFCHYSLRDVVRAISGDDVEVMPSPDQAFTPERLGRFLMAIEGVEALAAIRRQSMLFLSHFERALGGSRHALLVDTGLFGTTLQFLEEGIKDVKFSSALVARSSYGGRRLDFWQLKRIRGLSVEVDGYSPFQRRSSILRYWHLIESIFEPELPSVRSFTERDGLAISNLEIPCWQARLQPTQGSIFAGIMGYLDDLPRGNPSIVLADTSWAWKQLQRAVVWPNFEHAKNLQIGIRGNDFGMDTTSVSTRPWRGPFQALRGSALWREGDIARSQTPLRLLLLATIEAAYGVRGTARMLSKFRTQTKGS